VKAAFFEVRKKGFGGKTLFVPAFGRIEVWSASSKEPLALLGLDPGGKNVEGPTG
jgi:hypothetical protein